MSQQSFSDLAYAKKKKVTRREQFLSEMEQVVPWQRLVGVIRPYYPLGQKGRPPFALEKMLRVYCLQQWFALSDPALEEALYDSESMRRFAGFRLGEDAIPDESTILHFRHLLEAHDLTQTLFDEVTRYLEEQGLLLRRGTIVDATLIHAPSSTKNQLGRDEHDQPTGGRDPEMSSTKKNNQWYFGMKAHVGVDTQHGLVHTVVTSTAKVHDSVKLDELLHGQEQVIYGDKAYASQEARTRYQEQGKRWRVLHKAGRGKELSAHQKLSNHRRSRLRAQGEHAFGMVKNTWGHRKVRYRGLYKNSCQLLTLFALANLNLARHLLRDAQQRPLLPPKDHVFRVRAVPCCVSQVQTA